MVTRRSREEIAAMGRAGKLLAACHGELAGFIGPGRTTMEVDRFVEEYLARHGAKAEQKGYRGYPYATCTSVNDEVCHGFPDRHRVLRSGDLITVDFVVNLDGWLADSAWSYPVGEVSREAQRLLEVTREALFEGIRQAWPGKRIGDVAHAVQTCAESQGFSVVRDFTGHGIGRTIHEDPEVPHFGLPGRGLRLHEGMVLTIEPMINAGDYLTVMDPNGWTARTADGSLSAQYEHTIAITSHGPEILTQL